MGKESRMACHGRLASRSVDGAKALSAWRDRWVGRLGSIVAVAATAVVAAACGGGENNDVPMVAASPGETAPAAAAISGASPGVVNQLRAPSVKENAHFGSGTLTTIGLDDVLVNTTTGPSLAGADIAPLRSGGFAVAWNAFRPGDTANGIHVQRHDERGRILGEPTRVGPGGAPVWRPTITGLADGGYAVSWYLGGPLATRAYDAEGHPKGEQYHVNPLQVGVLEHAITALSGGGYVIAWRGFPLSEDSFGKETIYTRRFDAAGAPVGGETRANATTLGQIGAPALSALSDGGYVVVWSSSTTNNSSANVYARRFDSTGAAVGGETLVSAGSYMYWATVAALPGGGWVVSWGGLPVGGTPGIYMRRYGSDGVASGAEMPVASALQPPLISVLDDSSYIVGWVAYERTDFYAEGVRYDHWVGDLHARRYDSNGAALGSEMVFSTASNEREPAIAALSEGGFALSWRADNDPRFPGDIYVRIFKDALVGGEGSDWLQASDRIRVLLGAGGKDRLLGSTSHDTLDGGHGDDFMNGGAGDDTYIVDSDKDKVLEHPGEGHDTVKSSITHTLAHEVEDLILTGSDAIDGTGNSKDNVIVGNAAANRLSGGLGNDTLDGGGGHDTFVFDTRLAADNVDLLKNFVAAEDTIELDARIFKALPRGLLSGAALAIGSAATSSSHRILFDPVTGALMYDPDGTGKKAAVRFATLAGLVGTLSAGNFVVN